MRNNHFNRIFFWITSSSIIFFGIIFGLNGCANSSEYSSNEALSLNKIPPVQKIKVGGNGTIVLGESSLVASLSPEKFLQKLEALIQKKRYLSAKNLLEKYPDLVLISLRNSGSSQSNFSEVWRYLARFYDLSFASESEGWVALLTHRQQSPQLYQAFEMKRQELLSYLQNGRFEEAFQLKLIAPPQAVGKMLQIEAGYLNAMAALLANQNESAVEEFSKIITLSENSDRYQNAHFSLLMSATHQRLENSAEAETFWRKGILLGNQALYASTPFEDPIFWERAITLKQQKVSWPSGLFVSEQRPNIENIGELSTRSTAFVWEKIGYAHLKREEGQAALVAFQKSQSLENNQTHLERLQLAQCKALLLLQQDSVATTNLLKLAQSSNPLFASPALAMLGVVDLQKENTQRGLGLMLRALEKGASQNWNGRAKAIADLGLAYLMVGSQNEGLSHLHQAQELFQIQQQYEELLQSLQNEQAYLEQIGERQKANQIQEKLENLEKSGLSV